MAFQMVALKENYLILRNDGSFFRKWADYYIIPKDSIRKYEENAVENTEVLLLYSTGWTSYGRNVKILWKKEKKNKIIAIGNRRLRKSDILIYFNETPPALLGYYNNKYFHRKLTDYVYFKEAKE